MTFWLHVLNMVMIFSILGFGLNILIGYGGVISIAIAAFFGFGAYTMAIATTTYGLPWGVGIVLAVVITAMASAVSAWPALRMRGEYLMLLTIALQMVIYRVFGAARGVTGGTSGISDIPRITVFGAELQTANQFLPFSISAVVLCLALVLVIGNSPFGRVMRAMRDDEVSTQALGKNLVSVKFTMFAIAGGLAGFAGALYAPYNAFINPNTFSLDQSIFLVALVVLGGAGNFVGTLVGALILVTLPEALRFVDIGIHSAAPLRNLLYGGLLVLFMLFRPEGLIPQGARLFRWRGRDAEPSAVSERDAFVPEAGPVDGDRRSGDGPVVLSATGLRKSFGGIQAVKDVDIELRQGVVTALVGPNGAGKTSVFNALTGFVEPDRGTIRLGDVQLEQVPPWQRIHHGVARTFQDVRLFAHLSVLDNVAVAVPGQPGESMRGIFLAPRSDRQARLETRERALHCLEQVGMVDRAERALTDLSFGEQKLVSMARLLATNADVLLLDEPASGVDREWVERIVQIVHGMADEGRAVCIVEHNLDVVSKVSDYVYFMASGEIVTSGPPMQLIADPELSRIYFGSSH